MGAHHSCADDLVIWLNPGQAEVVAEGRSVRQETAAGTGVWRGGSADQKVQLVGLLSADRPAIFSFAMNFC